MSRLSITIQRRPEGTYATVRGTIDEDADLSVLDNLLGHVEIDLAAVRRVNSIGVRLWIDAMRTLSGRAQVVFVGCSRAIIDQVNMIRGFLGRGTMRSFYGPMRCPRCNDEVDWLFDRAECAALGGLPVVSCVRCGGELEFDDLAESYLLFIRDPTVVG